MTAKFLREVHGSTTVILDDRVNRNSPGKVFRVLCPSFACVAVLALVEWAGRWARGSLIFRHVSDVEKDVCLSNLQPCILPVRGLPMECHESGMSS